LARRWSQLAASVASIIVQQTYFTYHWHAVFVPLALLSAVGLASFCTRERVLAGTAALLLLPVPLRETLWNLRRWQLRSDAPELVRDYHAGFSEYGDPAFPRETDAVVDLLRSRGPQQRLLVCGHEPGLNFLSGLDAPTRSGYNLAARRLAGHAGPSAVPSPVPHRAERGTPRW
jgi:hypothetical protein